jgi:hypothetical protein
MTEDETAAAPAQDPFKKEEPKALDGTARPAATAQAAPGAQPATGQSAPQANKVS